MAKRLGPRCSLVFWLQLYSSGLAFTASGLKTLLAEDNNMCRKFLV